MKKNVLIVILALVVVGGGGSIAGEKLVEKKAVAEATVETTVAEGKTVEAVVEVVGSQSNESVDKVPATNAASVAEKVEGNDKVTYVAENKVEQKVETPEATVKAPAEVVTEAVKSVEKVTAKAPAVAVTEAKSVEKVTAKAPAVAVTEAKPTEKVTVKAPVVTTKVEATQKSVAEKISREKAKSIALSHAGVKESDLRDFEIELDYEKGVHLYEISFESGKYDYEYYIDATTGAIKFSEKESDAEGRVNKTETKVETTKNSAEKISREKAKSVALSHAGLKEADVRELEVELDNEKGVLVYEVSFESGRYEYSYDIDAYSGAIKFSEKDFDD